jgi:hypothetical protein
VSFDKNCVLEFEPENKMLMHSVGYKKLKCYTHETCGCKLVEMWLLGAFQAVATTKLSGEADAKRQPT